MVVKYGNEIWVLGGHDWCTFVLWVLCKFKNPINNSNREREKDGDKCIIQAKYT